MVFRASPRQSDVMIVAGTLTNKMAPAFGGKCTTRCPSRAGCCPWAPARTAAATAHSYSVVRGVTASCPWTSTCRAPADVPALGAACSSRNKGQVVRSLLLRLRLVLFVIHSNVHGVRAGKKSIVAS